MGLSSEGFDILQAHDKAGTGKSSDDPIMRMLSGRLEFDSSNHGLC
jgi:hypothetical protein